MTQYRTRIASVRDLATLRDQRHKMFMDMHDFAKSDMRVHDESFSAWARREMRAKRLTCFLVETEGGKVVGGGSLWLREVQPRPGFPGGKVPYLMSMYTDPGHRGKGVGSMVLKRAVEWSRARGYRSISLHTSKMGRPLYTKFGWEDSPEMKLTLKRGRAGKRENGHLQPRMIAHFAHTRFLLVRKDDGPGASSERPRWYRRREARVRPRSRRSGR